MKVPTLTEFAVIIERARAVGREAALHETDKIAVRSATSHQLENSPGGSLLTVFVDGRTKLGKFLATIDRQIPGLMIFRAPYGGWAFIIQYGMGGEAASVSIVADKAAFKVLKEDLGVEGVVEPYYQY